MLAFGSLINAVKKTLRLHVPLSLISSALGTQAWGSFLHFLLKLP